MDGVRGLQRERLARRWRPLAEIDPVRREQRQRQPVDAEGDAGGMGDLARPGPGAPGRTEVIAVVVEAHARGRLLRGAYRDQQLELQRLLDLADRQDLAAATEERIARLIDTVGEA